QAPEEQGVRQRRLLLRHDELIQLVMLATKAVDQAGRDVARPQDGLVTHQVASICALWRAGGEPVAPAPEALFEKARYFYPTFNLCLRTGRSTRIRSDIRQRLSGASRTSSRI